MNPTDYELLKFCRANFRSLRELRGRIPGGTLYRHAARLVRLSWLTKEGTLYHTTSLGSRQLDEKHDDQTWEDLERLYPPLALVPTPVHRALTELILAAVVARQHEVRPDRHPFFVCFGRTLLWKTSLGLFVCHALGLDPTRQVVDVGTESGKSLTVRRSASGGLAFERELLGTPFVTLDDFLNADASVRSTLGLFLAGRLVVAFENEQLTVRPVPFLTLNPRAKPTLEQQIGLSAPQIRRAILVNLDAVSLPDLAATGERALEAARARGPLEPGPPAVDCRSFHDGIVALWRALLVPEAHARVDVEIVVNLATGMTAFIPDPADAIAQVGHDLGVLAETLGWSRPGWLQTVTDFSLTPRKRPSVTTPPSAAAGTAMTRTEADAVGVCESTSPETLSLAVPEPVRRRRYVPDITLSEATLVRLVWLAHETGRDTDGAIDLLLDFYVEWRANGKTFETIEASLTLARDLELAGLDAETLHDYLADRQALAEYNCSFSDLPEALRVLELLDNLPTEWDWEGATAAMQAVADLLREGVAVSQIGEFMVRHRRLEALGFNDTAEALAAALPEAGAVGDKRDAVIRHLVEGAKAKADGEAIEVASRSLQDEVATLEANKAQLERTIHALEQGLEGLRQQVDVAQETLAQVEAERAVKAADLEVLAALRALMLGKTAGIEAAFEDLRRLDRWRKMGGAPDDVVGAGHVRDLRAKLLNLLGELGRPER